MEREADWKQAQLLGSEGSCQRQNVSLEANL